MSSNPALSPSPLVSLPPSLPPSLPLPVPRLQPGFLQQALLGFQGDVQMSHQLVSQGRRRGLCMCVGREISFVLVKGSDQRGSCAS